MLSYSLEFSGAFKHTGCGAVVLYHQKSSHALF